MAWATEEQVELDLAQVEDGSAPGTGASTELSFAAASGTGGDPTTSTAATTLRTLAGLGMGVAFVVARRRRDQNTPTLRTIWHEPGAR